MTKHEQRGYYPGVEQIQEQRRFEAAGRYFAKSKYNNWLITDRGFPSTMTESGFMEEKYFGHEGRPLETAEEAIAKHCEAAYNPRPEACTAELLYNARDYKEE